MYARLVYDECEWQSCKSLVLTHHFVAMRAVARAMAVDSEVPQNP